MRSERDDYLCKDYQEGKDVAELARTYGITPRRVRQILDGADIERKPGRRGTKKPLSREHQRIGLHLYNFRFEQHLEAFEAANMMGWSLIKLRKAEQGTTELELLDLMDIASYTRTSLAEMIGGKNCSM